MSRTDGHPAENDAALIVGRDLSVAARDLANSEGWADHARMHPATARKYEVSARDAELHAMIDDWHAVDAIWAESDTSPIPPAKTEGDR